MLRIIQADNIKEQPVLQEFEVAIKEKNIFLDNDSVNVFCNKTNTSSFLSFGSPLLRGH